MEKILRAALSCKYDEKNIDNLLRVIEATPNPVVATEILMGVYEEPVVGKYPLKKLPANQVNAVFVSYDVFTNKVTYCYNQETVVTGWIPKDAEKKIENIVSREKALEELSNIGCELLETLYERISIATDVRKDANGIPIEYKDEMTLYQWQ